MVKRSSNPIRIFLITVLLCMFISGLILSKKQQIIEVNHLSMGTFWRIVAKTTRKPKLSKALLKEKIIRLLDKLDDKFNIFEQNSQISSINALRNPTFINDDTLVDIIIASEYLRKKTSGAFDTRLKPNADYIGKNKYTNLRWNCNKITPGQFGFNLGGIAKGYGISKVLDFLKTHGFTQGMIDGGGMIMFFGRFKDPIKLGIKDPKNPKKIVYSLKIGSPFCASTSSLDGGLGDNKGHIIDPKTGKSIAGPILSATVICKNPIIADALSTAILVIANRGLIPPYTNIKTLLKNLNCKLAYLVLENDKVITIEVATS